MSYFAFTLFLTAVLFAGMIVTLEIGRRIGARRMAADPEGAKSGTGAIDGAVFALLGLLIAFTFSGATSRFDERRNLIIEETNDVSTAYLRLDLLPASRQPALRELFREYLDARLETYQKFPDVDAAKAALDRSLKLQEEIWRQSVAAAGMPEAPMAANTLLLPALNQMFDITTTRMMVMQRHPPLVIFVLLFGLALISALLAGFGMAHGKSRSWTHIIGFTLTMALAIASSSSWAFSILNGPGTGDDINVGALDLLMGVQQGPFTGGAGNPLGEEAWAESVLNIDLVFDAKVESISIFDTDQAGSSIRAFGLSSKPGYFILKNATWRAVYENLDSLDWAVIDKNALHAGFNLNGATISHATEFNGQGNDPDPDVPRVPVPGTALLLGIGLLGLRFIRKQVL